MGEILKVFLKQIKINEFFKLPKMENLHYDPLPGCECKECYLTGLIASIDCNNPLVRSKSDDEDLFFQVVEKDGKKYGLSASINLSALTMEDLFGMGVEIDVQPLDS
jgi:hypothetical protein